MTPKLSVQIGNLRLKNPVMVASGTFGYADEFKSFVNLRALGAIVTKTITIEPRSGNPMPRTCETPSGMLNSIGLENPGLNKFIAEKLPSLKRIGVPLIVSIASESSPDEFITLAKKLDRVSAIAAIELNISCPNVRSQDFDICATRRLIAQDPDSTYAVVKGVRKVTSKTLITKLSPNVTDITAIALAAERAGSDAISLINTLSGVSIDISTRRPRIACVTAGLSGPAIRPIAVRMCWETHKIIKIPIIGMGGIIDASSAIEFLLAGAQAVSVGTANFVNPGACVEIIKGIKDYLIKNRIKNIQELIGGLKI